MKLRVACLALLSALLLALIVSGCSGFFTNSNDGGGTSTSAKFAYVANSGDDKVESYTVNSSNGVLTSTGTIATGGTTPVAVDSNDSGTLLYAANNGSGNLSGFTVNRSNGALTAVTGTPITAGTAPVAVAVDPGSRFVFVASAGAVVGFPITSSSTGALGTAGVTTLPADPKSLLIDPSGNYLFVPMGSTGLGVYKITASTAALAAVTSSPFTHTACAAGATAVAVEPSDHFVYVIDGTGNICAFSFTSSTGAIAQLGSVAYPTHGAPVAIAINPQYTYLYAVAGPASPNVSAFKVNQDGTLTEVTNSPFTGGALNQPAGLAVDPSGVFVYVPNSGANNVSLYSVNTTTGALSSQGTIAAGTAPKSVVVTK